MTLSPGFRAFAHRDFRLFWAGQLVSLVGTWMQSVAQAWLVLELTNSPFRLGLIGTLQFTPMLLLSFFAGALADRVPKRRLILVTQSVLLVQALLLAVLVWHGHVEYWHVAVMATLYGIANTVDMPARQAFIVEMVGKEDLRSAIALNSGMFNGARIVGPAVAGLLIAHWGIAFAFLANALSFVAVIGALLAVRAEGLPHPHVHRTLREDIGEGIAYAVRTPRITLVLSLVLAVSGFLFNYNILVPLLARDVLNQGARGFGLLMSLLGMGAVAGAVALGARRGHPSVPSLVVPALALGAATIGLAAVRDVRVAGALLVALFIIQKWGTAGVGRLFGPVMLVWFATIGILGAAEIARRPSILAALNPWHGLRFLTDHGHVGFLVLGAVVLVITGAEALYADLGHFGRRPVRLAWFVVVLPALLLNYFGQGALVLGAPEAVNNPFFLLAPRPLLYPLIAIATAAAVVASQALISGAFSLVRQGVQLRYSPRVSVVHTSARESGQIYVPK